MVHVDSDVARSDRCSTRNERIAHASLTGRIPQQRRHKLSPLFAVHQLRLVPATQVTPLACKSSNGSIPLSDESATQRGYGWLRMPIVPFPFLLGAKDTCDAGRGASDQDTGGEREGSQTGNGTATAGSQTGKHTDVNTKRANITETSQHEVADENGAVTERVGRRLDLGELSELLLRYTHAPAEGIEDVAEDKGEGEVVDGPEVANVPEQAVDGVEERDDAEHVAEDESSDANTEPGTVGEGVQRVDGVGLLVELDVDRAGSHRGLGLGHDHLGGSDRGRDGHDGGGDEVSGRDAHLDVSKENRTGDGGETRGENLEDLGIGHEVEEALNQHRVLALADEGRGGGNDSLGTRDAHELEEEPGELANGPRHDAEVREQHDERHEEDDGRERVDEKVVLAGEVTPEEGSTTQLTLGEQVSGSESEPPGNAEESAGFENEKTNDHLQTETGHDGLELNSSAAGRDAVEEGVDKEDTEERASAVAVARLGYLLDAESAAEVEGEKGEPAETNLTVMRDHAPGPGDTGGPSGANGVGKGSLGNVAVVVEEDEKDEEPRPDGGKKAGLTRRRGPSRTYDEADEGKVEGDASGLVGSDGVPELAGTTGLALRVRLDGLDGRTTVVALDVTVGSLVTELLVVDLVVGAFVAGGNVLLSNRRILGELRSLGVRGAGRHDDGCTGLETERSSRDGGSGAAWRRQMQERLRSPGEEAAGL
ncbi:hypothetical protein L1887_57024 [Cichorium endivia]|nr:hypothetical protein L1887_57024 [Cichorium endivia]